MINTTTTTHYREVALALLFILDHQPLDMDAQAATDLARRRFRQLDRKRFSKKTEIQKGG